MSSPHGEAMRVASRCDPVQKEREMKALRKRGSSLKKVSLLASVQKKALQEENGRT
jgi:hypothetical protein